MSYELNLLIAVIFPTLLLRLSLYFPLLLLLLLLLLLMCHPRANSRHGIGIELVLRVLSADDTALFVVQINHFILPVDVAAVAEELWHSVVVGKWCWWSSKAV